MSTVRHDQIKARYLASMGQALGEAFHVLYVEVVELHVVWLQYRQLFGDGEHTVELLNRNAGLFFKIVQDELWDSVLVAICRLTDPANTGNRRNLTLRSLPVMIADRALRDEVEDLCTRAVDQASFAREHRNRRIAHQDHEYMVDRAAHPLAGISRELVEAMLKAIRDVMNRMELHFNNSTVFYENFIDESGARVLVSRLRKFEQMRTSNAS